jgi:hypothetical protein
LGVNFFFKKKKRKKKKEKGKKRCRSIQKFVNSFPCRGMGGLGGRGPWGIGA